jgi:hypothetical protein
MKRGGNTSKGGTPRQTFKHSISSKIENRDRVHTKFTMQKFHPSYLILILSGVEYTEGFVGARAPSNRILSSATFSSSTALFPHQFGGYDANIAAKWTPSQASEFVLWHNAEPSKIGMQLMPIIKNWNGRDLGEFLSRLFLGKVLKDENKIEFCPSNVRNPQWLGLEEDGLSAMKELLIHALPQKMITPEELNRCAHSFLLKEHRWPIALSKSKKIPIKKSINSNEKETDPSFDSDSFASMGHSAEFAKILGSVRKERTGLSFTHKELITMLTMPEFKDSSNGYPELAEFYSNLGIKLTALQKVEIVENLCVAGWSPSNLAKFICSIDDADEDDVQKCVEIMSSQTSSLSDESSNMSKTSASSPHQPPLKFPFTNSREASFLKNPFSDIIAETVVELKK